MLEASFADYPIEYHLPERCSTVLLTGIIDLGPKKHRIETVAISI